MTLSLLPMTSVNDQRLSRFSSTFSATFFALILLLGLLSAASRLQAEASSGEPILLISPAYIRPPIYRFLPESKRTILSPALLQKDGSYQFLASDIPNSPNAWDHFVSRAQERSALQLATLTPDFIKDSRGVIQMAVIFSDTPITASTILTPGFLDHFSAIFGPELLLAIPTQNKIYVFPKLANRLAQMTGTIRDDFLISPHPASTELFELSSHGLRAVGSLNPDDD